MKTRLMKNDDRSEAINAVLLSGLLPELQLQQFLDGLTERALRRVLGLPGCSHWTGRAAWDAWAIQWLHSKDRNSLCIVKATERIIARAIKEAQQVERNSINPCHPADAPIRAAAEAARTANSRYEGSLRYHALLASWSAIRTAAEAALTLSGSSPRVTEATEAEREQQYQDLLKLINHP